MEEWLPGKAFTGSHRMGLKALHSNYIPSGEFIKLYSITARLAQNGKEGAMLAIIERMPATGRRVSGEWAIIQRA
jgi:hypothetical protein